MEYRQLTQTQRYQIHALPKGRDFRQVSNAELRKVVEKLNDRPRERLGYRTPAQVFLGEYSRGLDTAGAALIA